MVEYGKLQQMLRGHLEGKHNEIQIL